MIKGFVGDTLFVTIHGNFLDPAESQAIINHSPTGFSWGYAGSGPAQLALAILLRFCKKDEAIRLYQPFKFDVIAKLPQGREWQIPDSRVIAWLEAMRAKGATQ